MRHRAGVGGAGLLLLGIGMAVIFGWRQGDATLVQLRPGWAPVPFNVALSFALAGLGFLSVAALRRAGAQVAGVLVAVIGFATLAQFLFALDFKIDELFVEAWVNLPLTTPGRMTPAVAALLAMAGGAMAYASIRPASQAAGDVTWGAGWTLLLFGGLYLAAKLPIYAEVARVAGVAAIGLVAAAGLLVLGVALLFGAAIRDRNSKVDRVRRMGTLLFLLLAIAGVNLWQALVSTELVRAANGTELAARSLASHLVRHPVGAPFDQSMAQLLPGYVFELRRDGDLVFANQAVTSPPRGTPIATFNVGGVDVRVWPQPHLIEGHRGVLPLAVLALTLLAAALVAATFSWSTRLRAQLAIDRAIWGQSRDILCAVDAHGRFVRVSEAARDLWGYEPDELIGESHLKVSVEDAQPEAAEIVADRREVAQYTSRALRRDGTTLPMSWATVWSAELNWMIAIGRDISDQVRHEQELEQRVAERTTELTYANDELEAFSYSVSHDLRTPLRAIAGFTELLQEKLDKELDDTDRHYLKRITDGVERMGRLIDDLLRLGRLSRRELEVTEVDVSALANEVAARLAEAEPARTLEFRVQPGLVAEADRQLVEVILENLFGNCVKYTRDRDPAVIELDQEGGVFRVRDNGVGFDMQYAENLFGVFQRLHHIHEYSGTGVGLATVKRIVERHGGRVWAYGEVQQGASFFFTLG